MKYTETRSESLVSGHHGRDQWQRLTLAATKDGKVTGLKVDLLADLGAYAGSSVAACPVLGAWMFNAIYKFDAYQFNCTTSTPTRPGSTPTAAPAGRRRRSPSSG